MFRTIIAGALAAMTLMSVAVTPVQAKEWPAKKPNGDPVLVIYHTEGRRSERIVWFCEEIGMPYTLKFKSGDLMASAAMAKEINPLMTMFPTVTYDGQVMVESAAILELLQQRHAKGRLAPSPD